MKKRLAILTLTFVLGVTAFTGCSKKDKKAETNTEAVTDKESDGANATTEAGIVYDASAEVKVDITEGESGESQEDTTEESVSESAAE